MRLGRITLILRARAHQNLAAGISVPAAIDVMGMVRGAATKAVAIPSGGRPGPEDSPS